MSALRGEAEARAARAPLSRRAARPQAAETPSRIRRDPWLPGSDASRTPAPARAAGL